MEYAVGRPGRVIVARLFEGEDLYESIEAIARKEAVRCAAVLITGGIRKADVVVGPRTEQPKIVPQHKDFQGPGEVLGVGTLYHDDSGPRLHIHTAMGRGDDYIVGCPRGGAEVFLILEVTLIEFEGIDAVRRLDEASGFRLLRVGQGG
ncbi:MAG TPA: DUF296 domain-containing protein [Phycisphaerales bacterium]|nr:DUF296 domain-containing protein [Phycisphaerales bacterium]